MVKSGQVDATATLQMPTAKGQPITGQMQARIVGYVPPHPRELDGILNGNQSSVSSNLRIDPAQAIVHLDNLVVATGSVKLQGAGTVTTTTHSVLQAKVDGSSPCTALAGSVASNTVGGLVGGLIGDLARTAVTGSVAIDVVVEADSANLAAAKVVPSVGVGCGLRGL
jgi:hypothetical protein